MGDIIKHPKKLSKYCGNSTKHPVYTYNRIIDLLNVFISFSNHKYTKARRKSFVLIEKQRVSVKSKFLSRRDRLSQSQDPLQRATHDVLTVVVGQKVAVFLDPYT